MYRVKNVSNNFDFVGMILEPKTDTRDCIVCRSIDIVMKNNRNMTYGQIYDCLEQEERVFMKKYLEEIE